MPTAASNLMYTAVGEVDEREKHWVPQDKTLHSYFRTSQVLNT